VTNLDRLLRNIGINTLLFTGTSTGGCVESAVHDALDLGYSVVIVDDGCADSSQASQAVALARLASAGAQIRTTAEITHLLDALPDGSHAARSGIERVQEFLPKPPVTPPGPDVNPYALIFPPAVELPLAADNTALLLLDAQHFTCHPKSALGRVAAASAAVDGKQLAGYYTRVALALPRMAALLAAARVCSLPVIHVRTAGQRSDGRDLARTLREQGFALPQDGPDAAWMPGLEPEVGELIINKPGSAAFTGTGLDDLLRNLGVEHLILAGISWEGALEATLRSATDRSYGVLLAHDACATYNANFQQRLAEHESGIIRTQSTEDVVARLASLPSHAAHAMRVPA
jgi:nicotinamidase-related amidase